MPRAVTMTSRDPRIDAYIERAAPFAQPILARLREQVHAACPEVEEGIKWGMPSFVYGGKIPMRSPCQKPRLACCLNAAMLHRIVEAKRDDTRQRRIAQTVEWLAEGKPRNWKYMKA